MLASLLNIVISFFAVTSMVSVGLAYTLRQIVGPLRDLRGVITAVAANFLLVPLLAAGIVHLLSLARPLGTGLILAASAAGAPFVIKMAKLAKGDVAFSAAILVLLLLVTIVYMPIVVPLLSPTGSANAVSIMRPLFLTMLLPLGVALGVKALWPTWAARLQRPTGMASSISLAILVILTIAANLNTVLEGFGTRAIPAAVIFIAVAFAVGSLLGNFDPAQRTVLGFATAHRNFAAAIVVATQSFDDRGVLVMAVITATLSIILLLPASLAIGRRKARREAAEQAARSRTGRAVAETSSSRSHH